jgi:hypothetical protein
VGELSKHLMIHPYVIYTVAIYSIYVIYAHVVREVPSESTESSG